ncbi:MAG: 3-dehydroquinate synthase [Atopobiaceae bacterium]|nr:3-dehydroquinate synthase [Atopobiaceae bacterium]
MRTISVDLGPQSYDLIVGQGLLDELGTRCAELCRGTKAFIICDSNTGPLYRARAEQSLTKAGFEAHSFEFLAGEPSKNAQVWLACLELMAELGMTRDDLVVALGGGVVGDVAGFVAASYMRGCALVQVPTSLLAMVDSSVGGKTAIDLHAGKNLVGAFWQPKLVLADIELLQSVERELLHDSCGEIVKHAILADPALFCELEGRPLIGETLDLAWLEEVVALNMQIKRDVVEADEKELGLRQTLNLGHTIGHAIEAAYHFEQGHGSCVALGMCWIARSCAAQGLCTYELASRIEMVCEIQGLPTRTDISAEEVIKRSYLDKKRHANHINVVVIRDIGQVEVVPMELDDYAQFVRRGEADTFSYDQFQHSGQAGTLSS